MDRGVGHLVVPGGGHWGGHMEVLSSQGKEMGGVGTLRGETLVPWGSGRFAPEARYVVLVPWLLVFSRAHPQNTERSGAGASGGGGLPDAAAQVR